MCDRPGRSLYTDEAKERVSQRCNTDTELTVNNKLHDYTYSRGEPFGDTDRVVVATIAVIITFVTVLFALAVSLSVRELSGSRLCHFSESLDPDLSLSQGERTGKQEEQEACLHSQ
jgi:hypothetical protein